LRAQSPQSNYLFGFDYYEGHHSAPGMYHGYRDISEAGEFALQASGCVQAGFFNKPRFHSNSGSNDLADWLSDNGMNHVRSMPYHPWTLGKIDRWQQGLKTWKIIGELLFPRRF
tara:strand:- start:23208 stop:23549 length:342 start_codon:yes stop_codon:yes gene_type:complete